MVQQSAVFSTVINGWTTASDNYSSDLVDQCPV